ncbi:MAG: hypothetical protein QXZ09_05690 [Candidatus Methanomethylicaceae archaeon]
MEVEEEEEMPSPFQITCKERRTMQTCGRCGARLGRWTEGGAFWAGSCPVCDAPSSSPSEVRYCTKCRAYHTKNETCHKAQARQEAEEELY